MNRLLLQFIASLLSAALVSTAHADTHYFHKKFAGRIDGRLAFTMDLKEVDGKLSGYYRYTGKQRYLSLQGKIDASGVFTMEEVGPEGQRTGTFNVTVIRDQMNGVWTSPNGDRRLRVDAHQTSEITIGSKRDILTNAIGTYKLAKVSGSGGINTMWDTVIRNGRWKSDISNIGSGRREESDVPLTPDDRWQLNNMTVTVDRSLTTQLSLAGKVLLTIPYRDSGMQYEITRQHDSVTDADLKNLPSSSIVQNETLYLLASDKADSIPTISGRYLHNDEYDNAGIVTVSYSIVDKTFDIYLKANTCCGGTILSFSQMVNGDR
ncbi:hypothetical protein [Robbsia sp. KACC 23696]|uniref:hypothetical protein n=1 Tax=Robbsia sp. KACC 23696 TaxID=3149231 RepID=UPI00325A96B6